MVQSITKAAPKNGSSAAFRVGLTLTLRNQSLSLMHDVEYPNQAAAGICYY